MSHVVERRRLSPRLPGCHLIPPGHKQGRGADPWIVEVPGMDVFRSDVPATGRTGRPRGLRWSGGTGGTMPSGWGNSYATFDTHGVTLTLDPVGKALSLRM
ncbi:hypothetical protein GCM10009525_66860 [Streptosporangium amethystogenes subsp. fukuiense]